MQLVLRRPQRAPFPSPSPGRARTAARWTVTALVLLACVACWGVLPLADARAHRVGQGPSADAYPLAEAGGLGLDPWGFVERQCTSYAAWYLNSHGVPFAPLTRGPGGEGLFLSAGTWDSAAAAAGFSVESTPRVGSIAQWDAGEASPPAPPGEGDVRGSWSAGRYGHVAVVQAVRADGSVVVSEYDGDDGTYDVRATRAPRYLHIGVPDGAPAGPRPSPLS